MPFVSERRRRRRAPKRDPRGANEVSGAINTVEEWLTRSSGR